MGPNIVKNSKNYISITQENISKYGFTIFHYKDEPIINNNFWVRDVVLNTGEKIGNRVQKFKVPEELLIELSQKNKIINSRHYEINTASVATTSIKLLSERAGWNQTLADLKAMISHAPHEICTASYQLKKQMIPLGSGVSLPVNDDLCWIGMILVHPELRRQGIARSIMHACLVHARIDQNKAIVGLDATPLGKQVYDSLGFKDSFTIWRSFVSTSWKYSQLSIESIVPFELGSIKKYLNKKNYTERTKIIELLGKLPGSKNFMAKSKNGIQGFVMSRPGRLKPFIGPIIADSDEVAKSLLANVLRYWKNSGHESVFIDIPEQHLDGSIYSKIEESVKSQHQQIPIKPVRSLIRMYQLVSKNEQLEKHIFTESSKTRLALQKALDCHEETAVFMRKEVQDIVPIMFGTAGPEWS